ncbi:hypothetical protein BJ973_003793 [Actinoplanes tereljensis]|uniref:Uncharacterized protein n=1 Tax=Paractinoplanes tereljensis TaxID=571912 RepID=A0A919NUJ6_9ACTN|nr:hypothetical protein [Actinoplanes tereljensis]GIF25516.1 hypothetical protein Ate02nite_82460 [Actinoplanes tereljensis]
MTVDADYRHITKVITPGPPLVLPGVYLKWYQVCRADQSIDSGEARAFLTEEIADIGEIGFVIHHLSGEHVHLLLVCSWRGNNEMWETVYVKDDGPFALMPQTTHRGVMCVWEFGAVAHEHQAWTEFLRSDRDEQARKRYAESQFSGPI